jgi:hypothetical protein
MRAMFAEAYGKGGKSQNGLAVVEEALAATRANGEAWYDTELYRLKGELLLQAKGDREKSKVSSSKTKGRSKKI